MKWCINVPKYEVYKTVTYDFIQWVEADTPEEALVEAKDGEWMDEEPTDVEFTVFEKDKFLLRSY